MNRTLLDELRTVYLQEGCTLFQYARQARLIAQPTDRPRLLRLQEMAHQEAVIVNQIGDLLLAHRCPTSGFGCFPPVFTNFNYFDFRKMLPKLVEELQSRVGMIKYHQNELIKRLSELKQTHLDEIKTWSMQVVISSARSLT